MSSQDRCIQKQRETRRAEGHTSPGEHVCGTALGAVVYAQESGVAYVLDGGWKIYNLATRMVGSSNFVDMSSHFAGSWSTPKEHLRMKNGASPALSGKCRPKASMQVLHSP